MGNVEFFVSMLIAGAAALLLFRPVPRHTTVLIASLIAVDIFILGAWFGVEKIGAEISEGIQERSFAQDARYEMAPSLTQQWRDYPVFGTGLGSFYGTFPGYRKDEITEFNYHAHNDYMQLLTETGAVGLGLLGLVVALSLFSALKRRNASAGTRSCAVSHSPRRWGSSPFLSIAR